MTRTVFVFGIDDFNLQQLQAIRDAETYRFEPLLTFDDVKAKGTYPFPQLLEADPLAKIDLPYPFWLKPVKGTDSLLGFKIENARDLDQALGSRSGRSKNNTRAPRSISRSRTACGCPK